jgi:hypothetical protein
MGSAPSVFGDQAVLHRERYGNESARKGLLVFGGPYQIVVDITSGDVVDTVGVLQLENRLASGLVFGRPFLDREFAI